MAIACIGQTVYDVTFLIEEEISENKKYKTKEKMECIGGPAANSAALCSLWNEDTYLVSRLGTDFYGDKIMKELDSKTSIKLSSMMISKEYSTPISTIITNKVNGNRTIVTYDEKEEVLDIPSFDSEPKVILVDGHFLSVALPTMKKYSDAITVMDAGSYNQEKHEMCTLVDYLVCSQDFAQQYCNRELNPDNNDDINDAFEKLSKLNPNCIVITFGDKGCYYQENEKIIHLPAFLTNTIDTTGAGDIFHGAFAYCIHNEFALRQALIYSSMAASISTETIGSYVSIPTLETVKERLNDI
ncbi:sugar/nucleoside kinase (ribokinase family) [Breznakia blatticola]|uniref:Sugar/nucleoside kinase (Ribokinase family) n=1 Tax=Breznakia blatticola TaxID=1754012 RepID=A0A4R7ZFI6_9FIRM|nr:PfkB family carbohydrate kinase [Breznakia blatticola]TDW16397.1 sugar/nucleoside kinase (ribokinase family) [Breznakia blatticola]